MQSCGEFKLVSLNFSSITELLEGLMLAATYCVLSISPGKMDQAKINE